LPESAEAHNDETSRDLVFAANESKPKGIATNKARLQGGILALALAGIGTAPAAGGWSIDDLHGPLSTLDGKPPLIIGHRGLPGYFPEETRPSYWAAAVAGADSLEEDLHLTKDCVLVARHNPWLSDNTNVAEVARTNQAVAARRRTVPGVLVNVTYPATPEVSGDAGERTAPVPERPDRPERSDLGPALAGRRWRGSYQ
jgi:glycerophosphoryl diester phosphodiesterase